MQEPYSQGVAHQADPESCAGHREVTGEALTGENADRVWSRESFEIGTPTQSRNAEGHTLARAKRERAEGPARSETRVCVDAPCAGSGRSHTRPVERLRKSRVFDPTTNILWAMERSPS
jgi:hypothetical protein